MDNGTTTLQAQMTNAMGNSGISYQTGATKGGSGIRRSETLDTSESSELSLLPVSHSNIKVWQIKMKADENPDSNEVIKLTGMYVDSTSSSCICIQNLENAYFMYHFFIGNETTFVLEGNFIPDQWKVNNPNIALRIEVCDVSYPGINTTCQKYYKCLGVFYTNDYIGPHSHWVDVGMIDLTDPRL